MALAKARDWEAGRVCAHRRVSSQSWNLRDPQSSEPLVLQNKALPRLATGLSRAVAHDVQARRALPLIRRIRPCIIGHTRTAESFAWGPGVWGWEVTRGPRAAPWTAVLGPWPNLGSVKVYKQNPTETPSTRTSCRAGSAQRGTAEDGTTAAGPYLDGGGAGAPT